MHIQPMHAYTSEHELVTWYEHTPRKGDGTTAYRFHSRVRKGNVELTDDEGKALLATLGYHYG